MAGDSDRILIVDDDPYILDVLKITLEGEQYEVIEARDGQEALKVVRTSSPSLIILDYMMPNMSGLEVCKTLKKDLLLRHLPIIMLTGKGELSDKVEGIDAGADDYIVKPFEPTELLARVKMILRRTARDLDANPLTKLPGNISILAEIESRIKKEKPLAVCYLDLDKFKSYNDKYGFEHGDEVIRETARILIGTIQDIGNPDDFIGHIGGDDFVVITTPQKVDKACQKIIKDFGRLVPNFYNEDDRNRGYIIGKDRQGNVYKIPLLSISIGIVTNETRKIAHVAEVNEIGAELKAYAKTFEGNNYVKDKRKPP